jgi:hypothetical protein
MAYRADWDPRSVRFLLGRRVTFNPDGSLSYQDAATEELAQRVKAVHEEVANGTLKPKRENDQLTQALGNKEHPGHTRGFGLIPSELLFPDDISTYINRMRRNAQKELEM